MKLTTTRKINKIIIHSSDTYSSMDIDAKEIRRWHIRRGWSDIGYHFIIKRNGKIETGRDIDKAGAHCKGHNSDSIGICYVGGRGDDNKPQDNRTNAQKKAMAALIIHLQDLYPNATIHGHNEFSNKACPCYNVQDDLNNLDDYLFIY